LLVYKIAVPSADSIRNLEIPQPSFDVNSDRAKHGEQNAFAEQFWHDLRVSFKFFIHFDFISFENKLSLTFPIKNSVLPTN